MKTYIIELPEGINPGHFCDLCLDRQHCPFDCSGRIIRDALPVREIKNPERVLWHKGGPGLRAFTTEAK